MPQTNECPENDPLPDGYMFQIDGWKSFTLCLDDEHMTVLANKLEMETSV